MLLGSTKETTIFHWLEHSASSTSSTLRLPKLVLSFNMRKVVHVAFLAVLAQRSKAFVPKIFTRQVALPQLWASAADEQAERERMEKVRSLQNAFYASGSKEESCYPTLDLSAGGILKNLSLWRVQWTELPGRSNILNVHEGQYTHLFETLINGPSKYFGHLTLPGGSKNIKSTDSRYKLKSWEEEAETKLRDPPRSAVVGTLMEVVDYRRMEDGRLLILVHALERFVVTRAIRALPYGIADVQILPDFEDLNMDLSSSEEEARLKRAEAVRESFQYLAYECDSTVELPVPQGDYLAQKDVYGPDLGTVVPFAPYASVSSAKSDDLAVSTSTQEDPVETIFDDHASQPADDPSALPSMESLLLKERVVSSAYLEFGEQRPRTVDEAETRLWDAMEEFCRVTGMVLPAELVQLLPTGRNWPFPTPPVQQLLAGYPASRRQRRLSYSSSAILEQTNVGAGLRQMWLETPDTFTRLCSVLGRYEMINSLLVGKFQ